MQSAACDNATMQRCNNEHKKHAYAALQRATNMLRSNSMRNNALRGAATVPHAHAQDADPVGGGPADRLPQNKRTDARADRRVPSAVLRRAQAVRRAPGATGVPLRPCAHGKACAHAHHGARIDLRVFDEHEPQFSAFRTERMNALKASDKEREKVLSSKSFDLETKGAFRLVKS